MPQYQCDLEKYINLSKNGKVPPLSLAQILEITSQVMKALQALHLVGFTHNDVKPSNIMIDFAKNGQVKATLIDFGFAKKFVDSNNNHIEQSEIDMFQGNLVYSSYSQMNFESTSRKDDLISIFYLLATMMNSNKFPCSPSGFDPLKENSDCST